MVLFTGKMIELLVKIKLQSEVLAESLGEVIKELDKERQDPPCRAASPDRGMLIYYCTLPAGHDGEHRAICGDEILYRWAP